MRIGELKNIKIDDVVKSGDVFDIFIKRSKRRGATSQVAFKVSSHPKCVEILEKYVKIVRPFIGEKEAGADHEKSPRRLFHKLITAGSKVCAIYGKNMVPEFPKLMAKLLNKPNDGIAYSGHAYRRTGASFSQGQNTYVL